jgi:hypothetical protein
MDRVDLGEVVSQPFEEVFPRQAAQEPFLQVAVCVHFRVALIVSCGLTALS